MTASFSNLSLAEPLARAVAEMGYESMTPIQAQAIPVVLTGKDVMGAAQTGTGKTAAFALPLLQRLLKHENTSTSPARHPVRALVLLPTRELADQVAQQVKLYGKYTNLRSAVVFGGIDMKPQTAELKKGVEVLVATPGRLLDHIEAKNAVLNQVEYVVLDEADRMLTSASARPAAHPVVPAQAARRRCCSRPLSPEIALANSDLTTRSPSRSPGRTRRPPPSSSISTACPTTRNGMRSSRSFTRGPQPGVRVRQQQARCARLARSLEREGMNTTRCTATRRRTSG
jgi:hypothetical protein